MGEISRRRPRGFGAHELLKGEGSEQQGSGPGHLAVTRGGVPYTYASLERQLIGSAADASARCEVAPCWRPPGRRGRGSTGLARGSC